MDSNAYTWLLVVGLLLATLPGMFRAFVYTINREKVFSALVHLANNDPDKFPKLLRVEMRTPLVALCRAAYELRHLPSEVAPPGGYRAGAEGRPYRERLAEALAPALAEQRSRLSWTAALLLPGIAGPVVLLVAADPHGPAFIGAVALALVSAYNLAKLIARAKDLTLAAEQLPEVLQILEETENDVAAGRFKPSTNR